ncbi:COG1470 family protein [Cetobacterium sp.]|uniref:COG1470 family protein n=2 Tax=Cetobacterium sp. TaxID=2071632 RepID=UPI002FC94E62
MKVLKKFFTGVFYLALAAKAFAFNIGIAPTGFYTSLDKNETHEIMVTNNTMKPMRVEVGIEADTGWEKYDMGHLMKIYPKNITLKPNGSRSVRFAVKGTKDLPEGEYKTKLVFRELPGKPVDKTEKVVGETGQEVAVDFELLTEIHVAAYGLKGQRKIGAQLVSSEIKRDDKGNRKLVANFNLSGNSGLAVIGDIEYLDANKKRLSKEEVKLGITTREAKTKIESGLPAIPKNSKYMRVQFKDKSGLKLGSRELPL